MPINDYTDDAAGGFDPKLLKREIVRLRAEISQLRQTNSRLQRPDNWFVVYRDFWLVMNQTSALFLCDLFNIRGLKKARVRPDGYFLCTQTYLVRKGWSLSQQRTLLSRLKRDGWVATKVLGKETLRWVLIQEDHLNAAVNTAVANKVAKSTLCQARHNVTGHARHKKKYKDSLRNPETLSGALSPPAAATAAPDDGGGVDVYDGMGLVTNQQNTPAQKRVTPAPIDRYYAAKLQEALKRRLNYRKAWNQTKWADEFRVLRDTLDQDTDRLEAVLDWYCAHAGEEYVPEAFSAGSFRGKFLAVEQQMKRRLADAPLPLSPEAKEVLVRVDHLVWPKGAKLGLPNMVQRSLDNYIAFGNQLRAFSDQMLGVQGHPTRLRLQYAHIHSKVKGVYLGGNVSTIRQWVERVHELVADWDDWSGNLKPWAWSVTHKLVQQDVESLGSKVLGTGAAIQKKWADYKREVGL